MNVYKNGITNNWMNVYKNDITNNWMDVYKNDITNNWIKLFKMSNDEAVDDVNAYILTVPSLQNSHINQIQVPIRWFETGAVFTNADE